MSQEKNKGRAWQRGSGKVWCREKKKIPPGNPCVGDAREEEEPDLSERVGGVNPQRKAFN